jgi:hypothetical protein
LSAGTFLDGYSLDQQFAKILTEGFDRNSSQGLRDRTMAAFSHFGLLRGENTRGIQLPDLQFLSLDDREGPTEPEDHVVTALDVHSSANKISISKLQEMIKERTKDGRTAAMWLESSESAR